MMHPHCELYVHVIFHIIPSALVQDFASYLTGSRKNTACHTSLHSIWNDNIEEVDGYIKAGDLPTDDS